MVVERGGYLLLVSTLAAGGAGGYLLSEKDVVPHLDEQARAPKTPPAVVAAPVDQAHLPAAIGEADLTAARVTAPKPACDDSIGEADACPPVGLPTEEGGCGGALAATRCADFKKTMKPRVAQAAVACLAKLKGAERCDPKRVELCGHLALMNACEDGSSTAAACEGIAASCGGAGLAPSKAECGMAMSGLKESGREALAECAKKHCFDKGIAGCETVAASAKR